MDQRKTLNVEALEELPEIILRSYYDANQSIFIVGISGAPATGKSTLAENLVFELTALGYKTQLCPMDGFHFTNEKLKEMGFSSIKGNIETFDVTALNLSIEKIFQNEARPFYWPKYSREIHNPISDGFLIEKDTQIFLLEGNYIFSDVDEWKKVSSKIDLKIFLTADIDVMKERLIERHLKGGKNREVAKDKTENIDLVNAKKIQKYAQLADYIIRTH